VYGCLDFAAADPGTYPNGYQLNLSDVGISWNYQPSGTRSQFNGSIISNSGVAHFQNTYNTVDAGGVPTFELTNTAIRAGKTLTVTQSSKSQASLIGSLGVALRGGAEVLGSASFTMYNASSVGLFSDTSAFDTTSGLWVKSPPTAQSIAAMLNNSKGSIAVGGTGGVSFAAEDAAYVSLTGLTVGAT